MKLIPMTDFVLGLTSDRSFAAKDYAFANPIINYAKFLKQPLKLEMFVPCDENGNVLIEPTEHNPIYWSKEYTEAEEKVLFEGFIYKYNISTEYGFIEKFPHVFSVQQIQKNTVEGLLTGFKEKFLIELTESAIKQINN